MPMRIRLGVLFAIALVVPGLAQQTGSAQQRSNDVAKPAKITAAAPAAQTGGLSIDGVVALADAGLSDDLIIAKLQKENKSFDLSTEDMIRLKKAKVSDVVMRVMLDPKASVSQPSVAPVQPVMISTPGMGLVRGISNSGLSGATPAPGADAKGDPNEPLNPHDSGIYLMTKDREGKPQMIVLERASYQGSKSGGMFTSAMTYGIVKAKTKAMIPGQHASIQVAETSPTFYFYFEDKQTGLGKTYFGVGNLSNPNQFALLKLEVTKANRESTVGQFSALGTSAGSDSKAMIQFKSERLRPGLYKVTVEGMKSGEYCFAATSNAGVQSPYGATAAITSDLFDFGVRVE